MTVLVGHRCPGPTPTPRSSLGVRLARVLGESARRLHRLAARARRRPRRRRPRSRVSTSRSSHIADRSIPGGLARAAHTHQADGGRARRRPAPPRHGRRPPGAGRRRGRRARRARRARRDGPITRVTCAFGARGAAPAACSRRPPTSPGVPTPPCASPPSRPQRGPTVPPEAGLHAERVVVEQWREQVLAAQRDGARGPRARRERAETLAVADATVEEAVRSSDWDDGDLLVVGASAAGAATRAALGDPGAAVLAPRPCRSSSPRGPRRSERGVNVG